MSAAYIDIQFLTFQVYDVYYLNFLGHSTPDIFRQLTSVITINMMLHGAANMKLDLGYAQYRVYIIMLMTKS